VPLIVTRYANIYDPSPEGRARAAYRDFIEDMADWEHWITLTFDLPAGRNSAREECRVWLRRLEQRAGRPIDAYVVYERAPETGRLHIHALTRGTRGLRNAAVRAAWRGGSVTSCKRYVKGGGAVGYLANAVADGAEEEFPSLARIGAA
jgi:hypothetical protein